MHHSRVVRLLVMLMAWAAGWLLSNTLLAGSFSWPLEIGGRTIATQERPVVQYPLALGAFVKTESGWQLERQLKLNGTLMQQIYELPAYSANKTWHSIMLQLQQQGARLLFSCAGKTCGSSAAWARQLFGAGAQAERDSSQRYSVFALALSPAAPGLTKAEAAEGVSSTTDYVAVYLSRNTNDQSRPYRLNLQRISAIATTP